MSIKSSTKLYFPNLNGLRFIAAFFVIINHTEQLKLLYKTGNVLSSSIKNIGSLGVMIFFVLSGFLITYLLLSEERTFGLINTKKFYIRRFLRIVPLYALIIFIVYAILQNFSFWDIPHVKNPITDNFKSTLVLHFVFLPNLAYAIYGFLPYISQAWSIGTEEQAYLIWPLLLKRFKKNRAYLMIGIIVIYLIIRIILRLPFLSFAYNDVFYKFWMSFNIDSIAVGGLFAVLLFQKHAVLKYIINQKTFYIALIVAISFLLIGITIPYFQYLFYSFLFGVIIINLAANKKLENALEFVILDYLGRISFGIYMYHFIVSIVILKLVTKYNIFTNWIIYPLIFAGTIAIASLSFHYFESYFLKLKRKYTLIKRETTIIKQQ